MRLLRLIAIILVLFAGYWAYYVFAAANPNDQFGVQINKVLPTAAREFSCKKLKERFADAKAPEGCADFAFWAPAPAAEPAPVAPPAPAPAAETPAPVAPAPAPAAETPASVAPAPAPEAPAATAPATDTPATAAP
jgi:hypothetical protein